MKAHRISIIIPVLNHEADLEESIRRIRKAVGKPEILLVWDITKPELRKTLLKESRRLGSKYGTRTLFRMDQRGFGSALRMGFRNAGGDLVVIMMGDLCDDPETIPRMVSKIDEGYDVVAGSRYSPGGGIEGNTVKQGVSSLVSWLINRFSTVKCRDVTNAFKMYRKEVLENVATTSNSFDISAELTLKAAHKGYRITQVPTVWKNRNAGSSNFSFFGEAGRYFKMFIFAATRMPSLLSRLIVFIVVFAVAYALLSLSG